MRQCICSQCALKDEGTWPEGHVASFYFGWCDYCGQETNVCSISDWNWPEGDLP